MNLQLDDFSKNLFWDVKFEDIDFDANAPYVIHRVLEHGTFKDWKRILSLYGKERIGEISLNFRSLEPTALAFVSIVTWTPQVCRFGFLWKYHSCQLTTQYTLSQKINSNIETCLSTY